MTTLKKLNIDHIDAVIAFDRLCFPTDFWNKDDWADLLSDPRAIYYALLDDESIVGDVFIYNWNGEKRLCKDHESSCSSQLPAAWSGPSAIAACHCRNERSWNEPLFW